MPISPYTSLESYNGVMQELGLPQVTQQQFENTLQNVSTPTQAFSPIHLSENVFDTGTAGIPFSGNTSPFGSSPGFGLGGLGETSGLGTGSVNPLSTAPGEQFVQSDAFGNFVPVTGQGADFASTVGYGGNSSFQSAGFENTSPDATTATATDTSSLAAGGGFGTDVTSGNAATGDVSSTGAFGASPSVSSGDLFSGAIGAFTGALSGSSSSSGGQDFFAWLGDWALRGAVILLGFIFIIAGLFLLKGNLVLAPEAGLVGKAAKALKS